MKNAYIPIISLIFFVLFFMITVQIRTIQKSNSEITRLKTENELRSDIDEWKDKYEAVSYKVEELEAKVNEYKNSATENDKTLKLLNDEITSLEITAGIKEVKGSGIIVTLDDTRAIDQIAADAGKYDPNVFVIHDSDIILVINELKAAGAEAVAVNGQRIMTNTEIRCVGPVIQINGIRLTAPFKIYAIGPINTLANSLKLKGGIIDNISAANIDVNIELLPEIVIPKYEKVIEYKYATPTKEATE